MKIQRFDYHVGARLIVDWPDGAHGSIKADLFGAVGRILHALDDWNALAVDVLRRKTSLLI